MDGAEWVLIVPAERKRLAAVRNFAAAFARSAGAHPKRVEDLTLAVDELVTNVIVHGYQDRPGDVEVTCSRQGGAIQVIIRDRAPVYDVTEVPSPDIHLSLEQRPVGGLGLHLVRKSVDRFEHRSRPGGGNELTLVVGLHPR